MVVKQNPLTHKTKESVSKNTASTEKKSKDRVLREVVRTIASILVALSGLPLLSDKVFTFTLENNFGFADTQTFIWVLSQSICPLLLILAANFKPYILAYTIPVYLYAIQLYWIFDPTLYFDDPLLHLYALGCVIVFVFLVRLVHIKIYKAHWERTQRISSLERILDLYINKQARENNLVKLKAILNRANRKYDRGEITRDELEKVLFDVYYEYNKIVEKDEEGDSFFPYFN